MVEIKEMLAPKGSKCRAGYELNPTYITIHNTANTRKGAGAVNHGKYLQGSGQYKNPSWHYAVDDKVIVHCIPNNENAWHATDGRYGKGNRNSLAIEICENPESNLLTATNNAAELTAMLMQKYNIPIERVVQHNYWKSSTYPNGKNCPNRIRKGEPYDWNTFLAKVEEYLGKPQEKVLDVKYQVYSKDHWLPWVINDSDYAGNSNEPISAVRCGIVHGEIEYRVHKRHGLWYGWVTDYNKYNSNGYAGVPTKPIDLIQMHCKTKGYAVEYRVGILGGSWLPWVKEYNNRNSSGYAGIRGKRIDRLQVRIVKE